MVIVGIDPGAGGGIAAYSDPVITATPMPMGEEKIAALLFELDPAVAWVELVSGYIGTPHPGSRMFNFGVNFGCILGALYVIGAEVKLVRPQQWQKWVGIKKKETKLEWKQALKMEAQRRHPNERVTNKTADALLILEYGIKNNERTNKRSGVSKHPGI